MNAPKLRFKGFNDAWKSSTLRSLTDRIGDGLHSTPKYTENGSHYFINGNNLINGKIVVNNDTKQLSEEEFNKYKFHLNETTILLSINGTIGNLAFYNKEPVLLGKSAAYINIDINKMNKHFIFHLLQTRQIKDFFYKELTGTTIKNLSLKTINETTITHPSKLEQQKIADLFNAFDNKIKLQQEKIDLLKEQKKGYLQKIFNQELRFKDKNGNYYPEWTSNLLENLGTFGTSYSFSRAIEGEGEYYHVHYGDIHSNLPTVCKNISFPSITEKRDFELINENDILFADASEDYDDLGKAILIKTVISQNLIAGLHTHKFTANEKLNPLYFIYFTQTKFYKMFVKKVGTGVSVLGISKSNLNKLEIPLPSIEEQRKISELFYLLDEKIATETEKIREIETQKLAFIQQMFI